MWFQLNLNKLYDLYAQAMYNIYLRMMNSRKEAEDMLQEAFSDAFRRLGSFWYESTFGAWLKRIVVNNCINEINRRKADLDNQRHYRKEVNRQKQNILTDNMNLSIIINLNQISACSVINL